jgi:hypothetical protein
MDDFGIARAGLAADRVMALQHQHLAPVQSQPAGDREADDPGADDDCVDAFRHPSSCRCTRFRIRAPVPKVQGAILSE